MSLTENKIYRILGVDPGTVKMGYALLEINGSQMKVNQFMIFWKLTG